MAEGKNIEVRIAATGGDAAAAEIKKLAFSQDELNRSIGIVTTSEGELASRRAQFLTAAEAEIAEINRETAALDRMDQEAKAAAASMHSIPSAKLEGGFENVSEAGKKVTSSAMSMRMSLQNAGYQIQDIAVQAEMGTPALRIMGQQLPQLLGGFGMWGAIAGSVIALGAPLAASLMRTGDEAKNAKEKIKTLDDVLDDYGDAADEAAKKHGVEVLGDWFDALDDEEEKIKRNNESLEKQLQLITKINTLKRGVEAADRDLQIANIESDPNLSDAEKTRQVAAYKEKDERRKAEAKIDELKNAAGTASREYDSVQGIADRKTEDAEKAKAKRESLEAEQKSAEEQVKIARDLEEKLTKLQAERKSAIQSSGDGATVDLTKFDDQEADLKKKLADAKSKGGGLTPDELAKKQAADEAEVQKAKAEEKRIADDAKNAREDAKKAYTEKLYKEAEFRESSPLIAAQYRTEAAARAVRAEDKAKTQEAAAQKKMDNEENRDATKDKRESDKAAADQKRRDDARRELETDGSKIGTDAAKAARGLGIEGHARTFERVGAFISKKSTSGSQDSDAASRMLKMIDDLVANAEKHGKANDPNTQKLRELEQRIEKLTQQMRNKNPGS